MSHTYQIVQPSTWPRAMHCSIFRQYAQPMYSVSFDLDITAFLPWIRQNSWPFTPAMVYAVTRCANLVEAFRYRFVDGEIALYDKIDTSFTYIDPGKELFKVVNVPMQDSMADYVRLATATIDAQDVYFTGPMGNDIYQFSAFPWVSFTHISHTDSGKKDNATPLFDWGKFYERDGRVLLPFSVQVHHSFVDGIHIGQFAEILQNYLNAPS
ncbi:MAG: chloramphenicol acetyltransferase [Butyricicoccus pullicaecorum]|nr:chloramphenicol acetyltransferase [Butyricicoccus pullicaecorum]